VRAVAEGDRHLHDVQACLRGSPGHLYLESVTGGLGGGIREPGWRPHRDWRVWVVALMLLSMAVYVLTMDESLWPGGSGPAVPAAPAPADAP
jgi:hypothetical protein